MIRARDPRWRLRRESPAGRASHRRRPRLPHRRTQAVNLQIIGLKGVFRVAFRSDSFVECIGVERDAQGGSFCITHDCPRLQTMAWSFSAVFENRLHHGSLLCGVI